MGSIIEIVVGSTDIDLMNHVNNQQYVKYLELGRSDFYSRAGFSFDKFLEKGIGRTIVNLNIQYYKEVTLGQKLYVHTSPKEYGRSSIKFKQVIYNGDNEIVSDAEVTAVIVDIEKRKSTEIPLKMLTYIKEMVNER